MYVSQAAELDAAAACRIRDDVDDLQVIDYDGFRQYRHTVLFGRTWCAIGLDEAHSARKVNRTWLAYRRLVMASSGVVAMTATPMQQSPKVSSG